MIKKLENYFELKTKGTDIKTEGIAGLATFLMMAYIIVVNPAILSKAGMPFSGVLFATVLVSALSSIAMGIYANLPYSLAPGMGINAFFTFSIVMGMGVSWQTALGAVFISGVAFIILSLTGLRTEIVKAIPKSLRFGLAAGIGLFLTFIGLQSVGFIVSNKDTVVSFGGLNLTTILFFIGLIFTSVLVIKRVLGSFIIGISFISVLSVIISYVGAWSGWLDKPIITMPEEIFALPAFDVFLKLDILGALTIGMILPIFSLLFVDLFDSLASFVAGCRCFLNNDIRTFRNFLRNGLCRVGRRYRRGRQNRFDIRCDRASVHSIHVLIAPPLLYPRGSYSSRPGFSRRLYGETSHGY